jgi:hypothetical protein
VNSQQVLQFDTIEKSEQQLLDAILRARKAGAADLYLHLRTSHEDVKVKQPVRDLLNAQGVVLVRSIRAQIERAAAEQLSSTSWSRALLTAEHPLNFKVSIELCSTQEHLPCDRTALMKTARLAERDNAAVAYSSLDRPTRPVVDWSAIDSMFSGTELFVGVEANSAAAKGEITAQRLAELGEATVTQHSDATSQYNAQVRLGKRIALYAKNYGEEQLQQALLAQPLLLAFGAALAASGIAADCDHTVVSRTSKDTQGADLPAEFNSFSSSTSVQQAMLATTVKACIGEHTRITHVAMTSDAGRSETGFTAQAALAVTNPGGCIWVSTSHRQERGMQAVQPLLDACRDSNSSRSNSSSEVTATAKAATVTATLTAAAATVTAAVATAAVATAAAILTATTATLTAAVATAAVVVAVALPQHQQVLAHCC